MKEFEQVASTAACKQDWLFRYSKTPLVCQHLPITQAEHTPPNLALPGISMISIIKGPCAFSFNTMRPK